METIRQVFVCSAPRSGSTFLDMLLGGHSRVASLGEFSYLGKVLKLNEMCGCGKPIRECDAWDLVLDRVAAERGIDLRLEPYALRQWDTHAARVIDHSQQTPTYLRASWLRGKWLSARERLPKHLRLATPLPPSLRNGVNNSLYLYDVIRKTWNKQMIVDSSKNFYKALEVYSAKPESTSIIFLTRDGRGVLNSEKKSGASPAHAVSRWVWYNKRATELLDKRVAPAAWGHVKYEELATSTEVSLRSLSELLNMPYEHSMLQLGAGVRHVVNGNQGAKSDRTLGVRLDESWRCDLTQEDLDCFDRVAGPTNLALGYSR